MPYHNPNSRSRRNVLRIVGVLVVLAVIAGVANFLHATTSEAAGNVKPQIETMQGIRQTAQDSITFAQGLDDPDRFAAHIETVQQCMDDYDRLADAKQIKYLLSDNLQERIIGLLYRNQQRTIIDSMRWRHIISTDRPRSCSARSTRPWRTISASMRRNGCCRWTIRRRRTSSSTDTANSARMHR